MANVINCSSAPSHTFEEQSEVTSSDAFSADSLNCASTSNSYRIEGTQQSECALVLFTRHVTTCERVVMKILRDYKDTRYSLETVEKRQQCQLDALQRNKIFTPEIYIGLARIDELDRHQEHIIIGEIIKDPIQERLEPGAEYALLMYQLPEERRLDVLLNESDESSLQQHLRILTEHVANIHTHLPPPIPDEDKVRWGSCEQLQRKLLHNFGLLDLILTTHKNDQDSSYIWLKGTVDRLKETLQDVFLQGKYRFYFEQRVQDQCVRFCHGDLKSPNIWILPYKSNNDEKRGEYVKILDAIDFNPQYCNVDVLSDFAMLVIDVQTRANSISIANEMIEYYLELTGQRDEAVRKVLAYYLVEKAFVGAAISIVYDNLSELGLSLLRVAEMRLQYLVEMQHLDLSSIQQASQLQPV